MLWGNDNRLCQNYAAALEELKYLEKWFQSDRNFKKRKEKTLSIDLNKDNNFTSKTKTFFS